MKLALQFGAGNIGRGFLGQLFYESGFHTLFVDVIPEVVEAINSRKSYPITIIGEKEYTITVENISAVLLSDRDKVVKAIEEAEIVATAVGAKGISDVISHLQKE
jgi:mannitol-1-phosphate 5-dehydrogenase